MGRTLEYKAVEQGREIKQVRPWHKAIARYVAIGVRPGEIAEMFGLTPGHVSTVMQSPLFEAEVARLQSEGEQDTQDIERELKRLSSRAVEVLERDLEGDAVLDANGEAKPLSLAAKRHQNNVAFGVLDRAGFGKKDRPLQIHKHDHLHVGKLSDEELYQDVIDIVEDKEK